MQTLPIFTSHHSLGCSILTLDPPPKPEDFDETAAHSIIDLCVKNDIKELFLVENSMSGLLSAYKNAKAKDIKLRFGIKLVCCRDMKDKSEESISTEHKIIVFAKKAEGYEKITNFYSKAATEGYFYRPRIDLSYIKEMWDDSVSMVIPFYYSFIHRNMLYGSNCIPEFGRIRPRFFLSNNGLPFDYLLHDATSSFASEKDTINMKSIYYAEEKHFKQFISNKCVHARTVLNAPNIEHLGSSEFSLETYLKNERK